MALGTGIEWTDATWNPVTGCTKVSPGCKNCYAERMARRLKAMGQPRYRDGFKLTLQPDVLEAPLKWRLPRTIFVNSMSDLFHPAVPDSYIRECFDVMTRGAQHVFQVLTKRPERVARMANVLPWPDNVWMGTSVESQPYVSRVRQLNTIPAAVRFLSIEPLLGPISGLPLDGIDWVIVGGESGPGARPMLEEWVVAIKQACGERGVPFFFKQWGGVRKHVTGRQLNGQEWNAMPVAKGRKRAKRSVA
ncbi:MAG TPA: phage Gp37/Gp68 family protein [Tepidisphaeraceae bacterium]|nr:phage Gp37/Gp68 family protein [Tepidisphaeraceae bacterium]